MIGKSIALIKEIPSRGWFSPKAAMEYLSISRRLLKELTDTGELPCYDFRGRRTYRLEDLDHVMDRNKWKPHAMKNGL